MRDGALRNLMETRARRPEAILEAARRRSRRPMIQPSGRLMLVAADHPARGVLAVRGRPDAMANRAGLLDRLLTALERPGVDGVLGTPDVLEDLLLLGALEDKVVIGSMNRGGVPETVFEMDDRFTAYDAVAIEEMGFNAGKMLLRIDPTDAATGSTLAGCADAVSALADHAADGPGRTVLGQARAGRASRQRPASRGHDARAGHRPGPRPYLRLHLAEGSGRRPHGGGDGGVDASRAAARRGPPGTPDETYASWEKALRLPTVRGLVVGRSLLYPPDDDVAAAVDTAVGLL